MNRERVLRIGVVVVAAALLVLLALHQIAVVDHEVWLERSYLNRWAFRDVPSRRGALLDAAGRTLAVDVPGFDLELRYRELRRRHPLGLALHGANLLRTARLGEAPYDYLHPEGLERAVEDLLGTPLRWLDPERSDAWPYAPAMRRYRGVPRAIAQDLRFYASRLVAELSGASSRRAAASLLAACRDGGDGVVLDALADLAADSLQLDATDRAGLLEELSRRFRLRVDELRQLDARLQLDSRQPLDGAAGAVWPGLWAFLESRREAWSDWSKVERLSFAERDALTDADFWRWLAARGDLPGGVDDWIDRESARREALVAEWRAERDRLREALGERFVGLATQALRALPEVAASPAAEDRSGLVDRLFEALHRREDRGETVELQELVDRGVIEDGLFDLLHQTDRELLRDDLLPPLGDPEPIPTLVDEARPRVVRSRLPYRFATWLGMLAERHPGLLLRPSVRRASGHLPGREDLGGFDVYLGVVTSYTREDVERRDGSSPRSEAARVMERASAGGLLELDRAMGAELPPELEESLRDDAVATLRGHFRVFGRVGRSGVEAALDQELAGDPGLRFIERDKSARESRMFASFDVTRGRDVELTLDLDLQALADEVVRDLAADVEGGGEPAMERALVVLDAQSGDVLAFSGRSRVPVPGAEGERWATVPTHPNRNPSLGSVVKPYVALEYLELLAEGVELPATTEFAPCDSRYGEGGAEPKLARTHECSGTHWSGSGDVVTSLSKSCNFFFYEAVRYAGTGLLDRAYARAGWQPLEGPLGVHYQDEVAGVVRLLHSRRRPGTLGPFVQAIGYGTAVPALMVARAYAGLATGALPEVGLVRDRERRRVPLGVDPRHLGLVREGLARCMVDGTGRHVGPELAALGLLPIAHGKSGTCVVRAAAPKLDNAWFALFLGTDDDAGLVVVASAYQVRGHGGEIGAPMVVRLLKRVAEQPELAEHYLGRRGR